MWPRGLASTRCPRRDSPAGGGAPKRDPGPWRPEAQGPRGAWFQCVWALVGPGCLLSCTATESGDQRSPGGRGQTMKHHRAPALFRAPHWASQRPHEARRAACCEVGRVRAEGRLLECPGPRPQQPADVRGWLPPPLARAAREGGGLCSGRRG